MDYQIWRRGADGWAQAPFSGVLPNDAPAGARVLARAVREDDNLTVADWAECALNGRAWRVALRLPAGGPYRLEARAVGGGQPAEWAPIVRLARHVGVGELFILAGQSNMAGYGRDMAFDPPELGVHLYANDGAWKLAAHPLNDSVGTIYPENCELCCGTSPALAFGRMVARRLGVPVGLVQASLGGSPLSRWHPEEDGDLCRAMMRRLDVTGPVSGVIWYQGCSDANGRDAPEYLGRFRRMVELWREQLGNVPVVTVQLNRWTGGGDADDRWWGVLREAQRQAARRIPGVTVVPTTDLAINDGIHNSAGANVIIGERMAHALLQAHYGLPGAQAPDVSRAVRLGADRLAVEFAGGRYAQPMDTFAGGVAGEGGEGLIPCASALLSSNRLVLTASRPFGPGARLHALWRKLPPPASPRDPAGMPMLSCYGVPIEE